MDSRLVEMIARGRLPFRGGQWIDTYNQITDPDCAGTIIAGINAKNHYYIMEEMKEFILDLSLKWEWYDMIERGEKTEEYREIKDYYLKRLVYRSEDMPPLEVKYMKKSNMLLFARTYNAVRFHRGQGGKQTMLFEYKGFKIGIGNPLWGAPENKEVFIIKLGKRIDKKEPIILGLTRDKKGNVADRHPVEVANAVTAAKRDNTQNYVVISANTADGQQTMELGGVCDLSYPSSKTRGGRIQDGGSVTPTLTTHSQNALRRIESDYRIRKPTPRECFRLMGVSDADIDKIQATGISKSQQYKMAGNSIVVNCLAAIFRQLFIGNFNKVVQTEIF